MTLGVGCEGYEAILLDNALAIREEGEAMSHCVGSYSEDCRDGRFAVYSIRDKRGDRVSTLGLRLRPSIKLNQHYGRFNAPVRNPIALELQEMVVGG